MPLEGTVHAVLSEPCLSGMSFRCGPTLVSGGAYRIVASLVAHGDILVSRETVRDRQGRALPGSAFYSARDSSGNARADVLYLQPHLDLSSIRGKALLIHEATHAWQDYQAGAYRSVATISRAVAETAAYLAQAVYYQLNGGSFRQGSLELRARRERTGIAIASAQREAGDRLLDALEPVAERLAQGGGGEIRENEYEAIKRAILRHPLYVNAGHASAGLDGVSVHHAP